MSNPGDGGPAFPRAGAEHSLGGNFEQDGMTLRDWFAGMALSTMRELEYNSFEKIADIAYKTADAMLAARNNLP